jgi:hypothetical protein
MRVNGRQVTGDGMRRHDFRETGAVAHRHPSPVTRHLVLASIILLALVAPAANACPVCFGDPNSPMVKGTSNGIMFLLGIVGFVQVGFVALFFSFWRRAKALKKFKEQFHIVR